MWSMDSVVVAPGSLVVAPGSLVVAPGSLVVALGSLVVEHGLSSCGSGLSSWAVQAPECLGSVVVAHGIQFPDQRLHPCPSSCSVDSYSLDHQGSACPQLLALPSCLVLGLSSPCPNKLYLFDGQ